MYPESLRGGRLGGPVAFFDRDYTAVVIMSPLNQFMATNMEFDDNVLNFGLMGSIEVSTIKITKLLWNCSMTKEVKKNI